MFRFTLILGFGLVLAGTPVVHGEELASAENTSGLKIRRSKIKVRSINKRVRPVDIVPNVGEEEVETDNAKVVAFQGFDKKGTCRLRLVDSKTKAVVSIQCQSTWILIPKGRDIVWIVGKSAREGVAEEGRQSPFAGAHLYDLGGRLLRSLSKDEIGFVEHADVLGSGELFLLGHKDKEYRVTRLGADGRVVSVVPVQTAKYEEFSVLSDGKLIALSSFGGKDRTRKASLLSENGREEFVYAGSANEYPSIAGVRLDGMDIALARDNGQGHLIEVFDAVHKGRPLKTFRLPFRPNRVEFSTDLNRLVARSAPRSEDDAYTYSYALVDGTGELLATAECKHKGWRRESRAAIEGSAVRWLCGDQWVTLEVRGAK